MKSIVEINDFINRIVWGVPILLLILGTGIFYTFRLNFLQFKHPIYIFKNTVVKSFKKSDDHLQQGEMTSFQAAMTSVAAIVGSGNIAGVATAIVIGGPGALFWMIIAAFFGMATKFAEIALGIKYKKVQPDGSVTGGAMYYLADGLHQKWLGKLFAFFVIPFAFVISAVVDTNTISLTLNERYNTPTLLVGIIIAILVAIIIFGGMHGIGRACEIIAPFMGLLYIATGLVIIILNINMLPSALYQVIVGAFNPKSITGGSIGSIFLVMRYGIARGIYSNEAGLGTAAMIHSAAKVDHPVEQALWGPVEVFLDTILVCTVTALSIVMSGLWNSGLDGAALTMRAFDSLLPSSIGGFICLCSVVLFGFSCLISYYIYAERASSYLFGDKCKPIIKVLWIVMIIIGSQTTLGFAWDLADTFNGLMIIPNLIGILLLNRQVVELKNQYFYMNNIK